MKEMGVRNAEKPRNQKLKRKEQFMHIAYRRLAGVCCAAVLSLSAIEPLAALPLAARTSDAEKSTPDDVNAAMKLWYKTPANIHTAETSGGEWMQQSLPLGNGTLGGLIFGGISRERVHFNEKTLWTGGPAASRPDFKFGNVTYTPQEIEAYRQVLDDKSQNVFNDTHGIGGAAFRFAGADWNMGSYQDFGDIWIDYSPMGLKDSDAQNYRRELDLQTGIASTRFTYRQAGFTRRHFVSAPDNVLVTLLESDHEGRLSADLSMELNNGNLAGTSAFEGDDTFTIAGSVKDNGLRFQTGMKIIPQGGTLEADPAAGVFHVRNADRILIVMAAETDYKNEFPVYRDSEKDLQQTVAGRLESAGSKGYEALEAAHLADHQSLFDRVHLDLGQDLSFMPTDALIDAARNGESSPYLDTLAYQFGRYLSIAGSRGILPSNLVGLWTVGPSAWNGDYHFNVNLEMNYWPVYANNLAECGLTYIDYMDSLRAPGEMTAQMVHGIDGAMENHSAFTFHTQSNIFGMTSPSDAQEYGWNPAGAAWCLQNAWDYYQFTQDETVLKEAIYPLLKEAAGFWDAWLWQSGSQTIDDPDSPYNGQPRLISTPSISAEQGPTVGGSTYDQSLVWELYKEAIEAGRICGEDEELLNKWQQTMDRLDPINISQSGGIKEWYEETRTGLINGHYQSFAAAPGLAEIQVPNSGWNIGHPGNQRHASHLVGLYPGTLISKDTPETLQAAIVSLKERGPYSTGWSKANKINLWARTGDGNAAYEVLENLIGGGTSGLQHNLFDSHGSGGGETMKNGSPIWQIDGNYGLSAGVAEMLLQSQLDAVQFLPALPDAWSDGSVEGLKARGNFTIGETWQNGSAVSFTVRYDGPEESSVFAGEYEGIEEAAVTNEDGDAVTFTCSPETETDQIEFTAVQGETYTISLPAQAGLSEEAAQFAQSLPEDLSVIRTKLQDALENEDPALSDLYARARCIKELYEQLQSHQEGLLLLCPDDSLSIQAIDAMTVRFADLRQSLLADNKTLGEYAVLRTALQKDSALIEAQSRKNTLTFSRASGSASAGETITIENKTSHEVRYTLDGSEPNAQSLLYEGGIVLPQAANVTLRAALFEKGQRVSEVFTRSYTLAEASIASVSVSWPDDWGASYTPDKLIDKNHNSRWASKDCTGNEEIEITLTLAEETLVSKVGFDVFVSSHNSLGDYTIEARQNGEWKQAASGSDLAPLDGSAPGNHFTTSVAIPPVKADALRITLKGGHQEPSIWEISAWNEQEEPVPAGNPEALEAILAKAKAADRTSEAWKQADPALKDAFDAALTIAENHEGLCQSALDARAFLLENRLHRLGLDGHDTASLENLIAQAEALDLSGCTRNSVYRLNKALKAAKAIAENVQSSQDAVNAAADSLEKAIAALSRGETQTVTIPAAKLNAAGSWFQAGSFMATEKTDGALSGSFTGSRLRITTVKAADHGRMHVTIKDGQNNTVYDEQLNTWATSRTEGAELLHITLPKEDTYTISFEKISSSPNNASSRGWCEVGVLEITQSAPETTDRSLLVLELEQAQKLTDQKDLYTPESWSVFESALQQAKTLMEKADEQTCTAEMGDAAASLYQARKALAPAKESEPADFTLLVQAVQMAEAIVQENGLEGVNRLVQAYFTASLENAKALLNHPQASQEQVNTAWLQLAKAIQMLEFKTDKSTLQTLVQQAEMIDLSLYEDGEEKTAFIQALLAAQNVLGREDVLSEGSIANAENALREAMRTLETVRIPDAYDLSLLALIVDLVKDTDLAPYTSQSAETFRLALADAQAVLAAPQSQQQINESAAALHQAWLELRLMPDERLLEMIRQTKTRLESLDLGSWSPADQKAARAFISAAQDLLAQAEPDAKAVSDLAARAADLQQLADRYEKESAKASASAAAVKTDAHFHAGAWLGAAAGAIGLLGALLKRKRR